MITGIHHYTGVTGDAPRNYAFYTQTLGMRLVMKTVNQDDVTAYHLFYGDTAGEAGSELTFFDWPHAALNRAGTNLISAMGLRVADETLEYWVMRFNALGVPHDNITQRAQRRTLTFLDPDSQRLMLIEDGAKPQGNPWAGGFVPPQMGIYGLGHATLTLANARPTTTVLTDLFGFALIGEYPAPEDGLPVQVYATGQGGPSAEVHVAVRPNLPRGQVGIGSVHHVAFRTPDDVALETWQRKLLAVGLQPTPVIDRQYHHMIYVREPSGILLEIATDGPGFGAYVNEKLLGNYLELPKFLEPRRAQIEAGLRPLQTAAVGES